MRIRQPGGRSRSEGHFRQNNSAYRGTEAPGARRSLDTGVKTDSQVQEGLISHGPESGLYPEDEGEGIQGENMGVGRGWMDSKEYQYLRGRER